jgi:hypothetical protein
MANTSSDLWIAQARNLHRFDQKLRIEDDARTTELEDPDTGDVSGCWVEAWKLTQVWVKNA